MTGWFSWSDQSVTAGSRGTRESDLPTWRVTRPRSRWWPGLGLEQLWAYPELGKGILELIWAGLRLGSRLVVAWHKVRGLSTETAKGLVRTW